MKERTKRKIRATVRTVLELLDRTAGAMLVLSKGESLRRLKNLSYYHWSSMEESVGRLRRRGLVEVRETGEGTEVKVTDKGKTEILKYRLGDLKLKSQGKWDRKWRLVLFDVSEKERNKRNDLRIWLMRLGLKQLQKSVWVYPFPLEREVKFLREVLRVPHAVKLITAESVENDEELREMFDL
ncbi:MAG: phenylacetic acid degradation operon negative regulatory protein [Microgenomates group bacterium Gr01-1014_16]|nr:MAG: phenylacetic acid degradation operon negative regulatory protein [Microgenomates group bacterium Gr01-1014_16]